VGNSKLNSIAEFVYRVAMKRGRRRFLWSVAGTVFWYGAVAIMVFLAPLVDRAAGIKMAVPAIVRLPIGITLLVIGLPMVFWTITRFLRTKGTPIPFNPPPTLVENGLYGIVRNPMHLGWTIVLIGIALLTQSFTLLVIFIPLFVLAHIVYLKLVEEKELEKKFGQAYLDYKKSVPMFIPKFYIVKIETPY
jgi:protein-S-isoprenylcysteine O-methyltransferase Ste14